MSADLIKALEDTLARPSCEFIRIDRKAASELLAILKPQAREDAQPVAWVDPYVLHRLAEYLGGVIYPRQGRGARQPLYTHPAPDALRVAVEALEKIRDAANGGWGVRIRIAIEKIATEALAALQAEQK